MTSYTAHQNIVFLSCGRDVVWHCSGSPSQRRCRRGPCGPSGPSAPMRRSLRPSAPRDSHDTWDLTSPVHYSCNVYLLCGAANPFWNPPPNVKALPLRSLNSQTIHKPGFAPGLRNEKIAGMQIVWLFSLCSMTPPLYSKSALEEEVCLCVWCYPPLVPLPKKMAPWLVCQFFAVSRPMPCLWNPKRWTTSQLSKFEPGELIVIFVSREKNRMKNVDLIFAGYF